MSPAERAAYLVKLPEGLEARQVDAANIWTGETGVVQGAASFIGASAAQTFRYYASLA